MTRSELETELVQLTGELVKAARYCQIDSAFDQVFAVLESSSLVKIARERAGHTVTSSASVIKLPSERNGEGGRLKMAGRPLDGMLVDLVSVRSDGTLMVKLGDRPPYKYGDIFHVTEWEYEKMWDGTV